MQFKAYLPKHLTEKLTMSGKAKKKKIKPIRPEFNVNIYTILNRCNIDDY